ncbi:MAG: YfhO family protein [Chloroflexota bacterium]|nr:YfhO family protein [Chloroflexota bacterium]
MDALNGQGQPYRRMYVLSPGVRSSMLDLLNVRYMVLPATGVAGTSGILESYATVYQDGVVRVLSRETAYPRAWLVYSAQQVRRGEALGLLASGQVDPARTALLEAPPPPLAQQKDGQASRVAVARYEPDRMTLKVSTDAPRLLVLSEMYYPTWKAYVDRKAAQLHVADHALRAVGVPAGTHEVELRYESRVLQAGMIISGLGYALLILLGVASAMRRRYQRPFTWLQAWASDARIYVCRSRRKVTQ